MNQHDQTGAVSEKDLTELFGAFAPDPDEFRDGVERRIAEKRRQLEADRKVRESSASKRHFLRRAAAVLPIDPMTGGLAGSAALKVMYTTLALPALVLGSSLGGFLLSLRSVKHEMNAAAPSSGRDSSPAVLRHGRHLRKPLNRDMLIAGRLLAVVNCGLLLTLLISFLTGGRTAVDVLTLVLLIAMGSIVLMVRGLGQAGLLSRYEATRLVMGVLMTVYSGCYLWFSTVLSTPDGHAEFGVGGSSALVLLGIVACSFAGWGVRKGLLAVLLTSLLTVVFNPLGITRSSASAVRGQLANMTLDPSELRGWEDAAAMFSALESIGESTPALDSTSQRLARAIEEGVECHPVVWTAAARMKLIGDAQWAKILGDDLHSVTQDNLLLPDSHFNSTTYYEYRIPMLLATRELSASELEILAGKLAAAWPERDQHGALESAAMLVHSFEWIGRQDLVESHKPAIHELLESQWVAPGTSKLLGDPGGFSPNSKKFDASFVDATWAAVELMSRVGVPDDIETRWVRGFLQNEARAQPLFFEVLSSHKAMPRAALLVLEEKLGFPQRSWFEVLLAERLFIATLLLVGLCLMAMRLAPSGVGEAREGAQP